MMKSKEFRMRYCLYLLKHFIYLITILKVARKDEETRRLQEAIEEARRKEEEARLRQEEEDRRREEERRQRELEEANRTEKDLESIPDADNTLPEVQEVNEQLKDQLKV